MMVMDLDARLAAYQKHTLHSDERQWSETNCYIDLWVELLYDAGLDPVAALGFTVGQEYEGDQFTFGKFASEDIETLYGFSVRELAIYGDLASHIQTQVQQGRTVLLEMDSFYLPDTKGLTYRHEHGKTTIGVQFIDQAQERLGYLHNSGFFSLEGEDYRMLMQYPAPGLPPYTEIAVRKRAPLAEEDLLAQSMAYLIRHIARLAPGNPIADWRAVLPAHLEALHGKPQAAFHQYVFNHNRQLGANFELLASYLQWLSGQGEWGWSGIPFAMRIAEMAKSLQFRLARAVAQKKQDPCNDLFDALEENYQKTIDLLRENYG